ncbi:hydrolase [Oryctes borbonicus]|uniref:Phosphoserine phosphatase n=1 Tax=Oryctes borbonicus TaxID=1629725 RepID=A0A0T6AWF8_9SCAR|nr:hydrolase [Oryctes borbonicus]
MSGELRTIWNSADAICFDVDSTVIKEEGIDELAKFCNKGSEVAELTKRAMVGVMTFQEALKLRLDIIQPTLSQLRQFIQTKPPTLSPGIKNLVQHIHNRGIPVYLISGGFRSIIAAIAKSLNIPLENIFANRIKFYFNGDYAGFDENEFTSRSGGKAAAIQKLKDVHGYKHVILIGDGATDLEACPPADIFIGYGGNVIRESVKSKAKWYITDFSELGFS